MTLNDLNDASQSDAEHIFLQCCTSERWVQRMASGRPYSSLAGLKTSADCHWHALDEKDYLQAFDGHPKIGDVNSLKEKYRNTKNLASGEQSNVALASDDIIQELARLNKEYEDKYGFIFIVCATNKTAEEILHMLRERISNTRDIELKNAANEQRKIFHLRINKFYE